MKGTTKPWVSAFALLALSGFAMAGTVALQHVHGLAYGADGRTLYVASHHGLVTYKDGQWTVTAGPAHDYMSLAATRKHFYSSGHPPQGSRLVNPLGLIRSGTGGRSWDKIGLEGEADFHLIAAGYDTTAVYVYNAEPNARMKAPGIWATVNDGFAWRRVNAKGLGGKVTALAAHPSDARTLAAATAGGLFLSRDGGEQFEKVAGNGQTLAVHFSLDGHDLWFATHDGRAHLYRVDLATRKRTEVTLPPLAADAVAYIAQNPAMPSTYAIATFERDVFVTTNDG
ncbi:MAG: glycosyl hydrolase, partial [Betaproteobacteria bacterium]|nr:glycosyl hydrolase [Betaproteobacteria bacterium]